MTCRTASTSSSTGVQSWEAPLQRVLQQDSEDTRIRIRLVLLTGPFVHGFTQLDSRIEPVAVSRSRSVALTGASRTSSACFVCLSACLHACLLYYCWQLRHLEARAPSRIARQSALSSESSSHSEQAARARSQSSQIVRTHHLGDQYPNCGWWRMAVLLTAPAAAQTRRPATRTQNNPPASMDTFPYSESPHLSFAAQMKWPSETEKWRLLFRRCLCRLAPLGIGHAR
jgi:hypothetical protein